MTLAVYDHDNAGAAAAAAVAGMGLIGLLVILGFVVLGLAINWVIAAKAGYHGALSLLMLVPFVNFIVLLVFAFSRWPIERELEQARGGTAGWASSSRSRGFTQPERPMLPPHP